MLRNHLELLKAENKQSLEKLDLSVRKFIKNNVDYVRAKGLGMYETEIFQKDLIGMSLEASIRNENVSEMLGTSEQKFCDSVLENSQKPKYEMGIYCLYQS